MQTGRTGKWAISVALVASVALPGLVASAGPITYTPIGTVLTVPRVTYDRLPSAVRKDVNWVAAPVKVDADLTSFQLRGHGTTGILGQSDAGYTDGFSASVIGYHGGVTCETGIYKRTALLLTVTAPCIEYGKLFHHAAQFSLDLVLIPRESQAGRYSGVGVARFTRTGPDVQP